jgi:type IX secretion system PorP/SprF family membrane protein
MKHLYLSLFILTCSIARLNAQQTYPIFTQNYANPFALNPSMITLDGRSEINVMYRQQWSGISNAPKTIQADLQYLLSKKISIGLNAYNDKTIMLNSSGALATFGYRVLLSSRHVLGFGLSGGFISNNVDLSEVAAPDLPDMALYKSNEFMPDAQAGLHYRNRNLVIGGSLLKLVDNLPYKNLNEESSSRKFDAFKDRAAFMSYKINLSPASSLQPVVYYRNTFTGYEYFEGTLLFNYKAITIGGGYRTDFGPTALLRVRIKDFHAGFSYDLPSNHYGGSTGGTYEAQLKFQLGRTVNPLAQKEESDSVQSLADKPIEPEEENKQEVAAAETEKPAQKNQPAVTPQTTPATSPAKTDAVVTNTAPPTSLQPSTPSAKDPGAEAHAPHVEQTVGKSTNEAANAGHYLVVGAYRNLDNALKQLENLKAKGHQPGIIYLSEKQYHYVYLFHSGNKQETVDRLRRIRQQNQFFGAWLLNVE